MLDQLLGLLRSGGTHRVADLARELDTTTELVEIMLEDLRRMGRLKRMEGSCTAESCETCPMAGLCAAGGGGRLWTLVEESATDR